MANADASAAKEVIDARTSALNELTKIGFTPRNKLDKFLLYNEMEQRTENNVMYNINGVV